MTEVVCVTVDCTNPGEIASFWNEALGWGGVATADDGSGAVCGPPSGGWYLEFVRVPEIKTIKNRLHLGCSAGTLDQLDDEMTRLQSLGATFAREEEFDAATASRYRNVVLREPEGNEFCLSAGDA